MLVALATDTLLVIMLKHDNSYYCAINNSLIIIDLGWVGLMLLANS